MDYLEKAARVLDIEIFELKRLRDRLSQNFSRAVELIKDAIDARSKVVVVGVGKSGHIGAKIAATLTSTGSPAVVLDSSNALHGDLGMIADGDVVLALSASGETEELLRILPAIARFQVRIIAMCGDPKSALANPVCRPGFPSAGSRKFGKPTAFALHLFLNTRMLEGNSGENLPFSFCFFTIREYRR